MFGLISALLLILSFPNFNLYYLGFIAFIPLFIAVEGRPPKKAFLISYLCGFLFYLGVLYWLYHVTIIGLVVLCAYLALYIGVLGTIFSVLNLRFSVSRIWLVPFIWILLEYIQAHLFTGFGWCLIGYSQYKNLPLIQIADFSGVYGVSFVMMMVNVTLYMVLQTIKRRIIYYRKNALSVISCSVVAILILIATYSYGFFKLSKKDGMNSITVSVIQGNIPQEIKWDIDARDIILDRYKTLTREASIDRDRPDLIIWPETSFPDYFEIDNKKARDVINLATEIEIPILLGANTRANEKSFNSAILISRKGEILDRYDKIHLVPFGEYVPFSKRVPVLHNLILGELGEFTPGVEFKIFKLQTYRFKHTTNFAVLICFEDIFPEIAKRFVKEGAQFLVVITNDAWYGNSPAAYQHAACSVFRAIENRVPVVRCANTGYSCFIDSKGRIYDAVEENKTHLFVTGYKNAEIKIRI